MMRPRRLLREIVDSRVGRNISYTLARQLLAAAAQLLLVILVARQLGPSGNGQYAMALLLPALMLNLLNLGVGPATVYYVSRGEFPPQNVVRQNFRLGIFTAAAGLSVALPLVALFGSRLFPAIPVPLLYFGLVAFPFSLLLNYLNSILQGLEEFRAFNTTELLPPYITLICVWGALYPLGLGVEGALGGYIIGQMSGLTIVIWALLKKVGFLSENSSLGTFKNYVGKLLNYGWKAHLSNILAFVNYRADIYIVNFFLNPAATGLYVIAVQFAERIWMLSQAASTVLFPRLSAMHDAPEGRLRLARRGALIVYATTAFGAVSVALVLNWLLVPLFGPDFQGAWPAFLWLLPGIVAGAGARINSNCIAAAGKPEWNMYIAVVVVSLNIVGNIALVPHYGIQGAAWATSGVYLLNAIIKQYLVGKTMKL